MVPARPYSFVEDIGRIVRIPPPATLALFLLTVLVFVGQVLGGSSRWQRAVGVIPLNVSEAWSVMRIADGQLLPIWLTLLSYMFLHGGLFHLLANMAGLWMFGILAEPVMGSKRFFLTYLICGVMGGITLAAIAPHWTSPMVGASCAISGIVGAFLALRLSDWRAPAIGDISVLLVEGISWLAVAAWFNTRTIPAEPDRTSSFAWHFIPFLLAWSSVRLERWFRITHVSHETVREGE